MGCLFAAAVTAALGCIITIMTVIGMITAGAYTALIEVVRWMKSSTETPFSN